MHWKEPSQNNYCTYYIKNINNNCNQVIQCPCQIKSIYLYTYIKYISCEILNSTLTLTGGRRSPAVAFWASDHWVASSNPPRGKFRHYFHLIIPGVCLAQFSLNNVHKRGLKHHHFIYININLWGVHTHTFTFSCAHTCNAPICTHGPEAIYVQ